jgi:7-cyano-7-deazaguanine synthase
VEKKKKEKAKAGESRKAVVLMSGGLDSTTVVGMLVERKFTVYPLSINYGQRHAVELECMKSIVKYYQDAGKPVKDVFELKLDDLARIGGSALTDKKIEVPKDRDEKKMSAEIPVTYVPGRNTIFLSIALAYAEVIKAKSVAIGVNALDYSGYPDCRPEYIAAMNAVAKLSSKRAVEGSSITIETPILQMTKAQIITAGTRQAFKVPYELTWSCYQPQEVKTGLFKGKKYKPCGECDSCKLRAMGFKEVGIADPALETPISKA